MLATPQILSHSPFLPVPQETLTFPPTWLHPLPLTCPVHLLCPLIQRSAKLGPPLHSSMIYTMPLMFSWRLLIKLQEIMDGACLFYSATSPTLHSGSYTVVQKNM